LVWSGGDVVDLSQVKESLGKVPVWGWAVGGGVLIGGFVLLRRGPATVSPAMIPTAPIPGPKAPAPTQGSGDSLKGVLEGLQSQQASFMAQSLAQDRQQYAGFLSSVQNIWSGQRESLTEIQHQVSAAMLPAREPEPILAPIAAIVPEPIAALVPETATLKSWVDGDVIAGYVNRVISFANDFDRGIYAAKQRYYSAEDAGDAEGKAQAAMEAARLRALAKTEGVELSEWAR